MAINLIELVSSAITPDAVQEISRVLGESDSAVQRGIAAMVPNLLGGMAAKASTPSGASGLLAMTSASGADGSAGSMGKLLGSGESSDLLQQGGNLLGGLFGADRSSGIAAALAGMTGMKTGSASSLLMMVTPMVFGALNRFFAEKRLGAGDVAGLFQEQGPFLEGKLDDRLTSAMGLGSASQLLSGLGETAARATRGAAAMAGTAGAGAAAASSTLASSAATPSGSRWMPWALVALVAAVVLWMLPRDGADKEAPVATAPSSTATPAAPSPATARPAATTVMGAPAAPPAASLVPAAPAAPTAAMGAAPATLPAKVYFDTGKAQLGPDSAAVIQSVAGLLAADPTAKVDITGFTDMTGDASANVELGKRRAMAVRAALASAGVASDRVSMKTPMSVEGGAGDADAEARRVEITAGK